MLNDILAAEKEVNHLFLDEFKIRQDVKMFVGYAIAIIFGVLIYQMGGN